MTDENCLVDRKRNEDADEIADALEHGVALGVVRLRALAVASHVERGGAVAGIDDGVHLAAPASPSVGKAVDE